MYRRVSNNTKITHFHSLGHKSIILHCWPATGNDVLPSATEKRVMARDAHHRELVSPTDTCDAHSRHGSISKAGLNFHLAPKHTTPLPMWVYGCKSLLTSQGGVTFELQMLLRTNPCSAPCPWAASSSPIPLQDPGKSFLPEPYHSRQRNKPNQNLKIYYQKPSSEYTRYLIKQTW